MEVGVLGNDVLVLVKIAASLADGNVEIIDGVEVFVDERLIDERPKVLGGLYLGAIGRLVDEPDAVGDGQVFRCVPAGIVERENDDAVAPGAGLAGKGYKQFGEEEFVDPVRQIPDRLSAGRVNEGGDVEPFVAVMAERDRPLADRRPDPATDRLQADPMLIRRPQLDRLVGMLLGFFGERVGKLS
jgi:hypothetical protein